MSDLSIEPKQWIDFGGYRWPDVFDSVTEEYRLLMEDRGLVILPAYEYIKLEGPDVKGFLQGLLSQDVNALGRGETAESWALDANGKIIALFDLCCGDGFYLLQTPHGLADRLVTHLNRYLIMEDVTISRPDLTCAALVGPNALYEKERL